MSAAAAWSYTATATVWSMTGRDDWSRVRTFGAPTVIACDYSEKAQQATDARGQSFTTRLVLWTEADAIKAGDMVLLGEHADADPVAAGAHEVRAVQRDADTFDRQADDFTVMTA